MPKYTQRGLYSSFFGTVELVIVILVDIIIPTKQKKRNKMANAGKHNTPNVHICMCANSFLLYMFGIIWRLNILLSLHFLLLQFNSSMQNSPWTLMRKIQQILLNNLYSTEYLCKSGGDPCIIKSRGAASQTGSSLNNLHVIAGKINHSPPNWEVAGHGAQCARFVMLGTMVKDKLGSKIVIYSE